MSQGHMLFRWLNEETFIIIYKGDHRQFIQLVFDLKEIGRLKEALDLGPGMEIPS